MSELPEHGRARDRGGGRALSKRARHTSLLTHPAPDWDVTPGGSALQHVVPPAHATDPTPRSQLPVGKPPGLSPNVILSTCAHYEHALKTSCISTEYQHHEATHKDTGAE